MSGFLGADTEALREQAEALRTGAQRLGELKTSLSAQVASAEWVGPDAESFRSDFSSRVSSLFDGAIGDVGSRAQQIDEQAQEQDQVSAAGADGEGGGLLDSIGDLLANPAVVTGLTAFSAVTAALDMVKGIKQIRDLGRYTEAIRRGLTGAAARIAGRMHTTGLGMLGRVGGRIFGPLGVVTGIMDMVNPPHDGWRGVGDRVAGGLGVIGGVGMTALALGATLNPVGLAVVGVAAAGAGLWAAGNAIWDNREAIGDFIGDVGGHVSDAVDTAGEVLSDVGEGAMDAVDSIKDGVGDFVGGIF